jgi:hypothetical protein
VLFLVVRAKAQDHRRRTGEKGVLDHGRRVGSGEHLEHSGLNGKGHPLAAVFAWDAETDQAQIGQSAQVLRHGRRDFDVALVRRTQPVHLHRSG